VNNALLRELTPQVLSAVMRRFGDFGACEDAVQEALIAAVTQWPRDGVPENPRGWLYSVAARRITDQVRAESARKHREQLVVGAVPFEEQIAALQPERDDTLELLFTCCHPALSTSSAIALTLRALGGLTTLEIAKAFLVPEATMAQRISRAKETIKSSGAGFATPTTDQQKARLVSVMHVLYLIFNEGYTASSGTSLVRDDLAHEAMRLTRMLLHVLPDNAEARGLLALMLLTDARRAARVGPNGELIPLDEQDRGVWDRAAIAEGLRLVTSLIDQGLSGPYQVQATIAALHDEAPSTEATDWGQIVKLYRLLQRMEDSPVIALNLAIAVAMADGPAHGLTLLEPLASDERLAHRVDAAKAHLYERAGDCATALTFFERAAEHATSVPERNYLLARAARLRT
jgi:RNA polymerase sigma factor (sigma-70 family)